MARFGSIDSNGKATGSAGCRPPTPARWRQAMVMALFGTLVGTLVPTGVAQAAGAVPPMVTIVDGEAQLIDGARALQAAEDLALDKETIVRTSARSTLLRIEWPDGTVADLGPDTHAMINPGGMGSRDSPAPALYLMRGWLKLGSLGTAPAPGLLTPRLQVPAFKGSLVLMAGADETWVFAEAGNARVSERDQKAAPVLALKAGEVYLRSGSGSARGSVSPRPSPAQMQRVPRGFRDSLPLRAGSLKDRKPVPRPAPAPTYAELREWLAAEAPLRRPFTRRFVALTRDPEFRSGLIDNLREHPEWERVLFPERFIKPASAPR